VKPSKRGHGGDEFLLPLISPIVSGSGKPTRDGPEASISRGTVSKAVRTLGRLTGQGRRAARGG